MKKPFSKWIDDFRDNFNSRELNYLNVHKAEILLQLKDAETGEIHLHKLEYTSKEAENLAIKGAV